ncbi:MAG: hypothetical protein EAZ53_08235 [Bacteroidetes bacterium]|nr:MAG: hypothetical protein EAZ53_08235 [Bacteroidota bacterium]
MGQVIINSSLRIKLDDLVDILYYKHFFGYRDSAEKYVQRIYDFIETIPNQPLKLCKTPKYGKYYARFKNPNSDMSYYITFNLSKERFYIKDIISPKTKAYLAIRGLK